MSSIGYLQMNLEHPETIQQTIITFINRFHASDPDMVVNTLQRALEAIDHSIPVVHTMIQAYLSRFSVHSKAASDKAIQQLKRYTMTRFDHDVINRENNKLKFPSHANTDDKNNNTNTEDEPYTCAVCLSELEIGEEVIEFSCSGKHTFHSTCLLDWLKRKNSCVTCRYEIYTNNSKYNKDVIDKQRMKELRDKDKKQYNEMLKNLLSKPLLIEPPNELTTDKFKELENAYQSMVEKNSKLVSRTRSRINPY